MENVKKICLNPNQEGVLDLEFIVDPLIPNPYGSVTIELNLYDEITSCLFGQSIIARINIISDGKSKNSKHGERCQSHRSAKLPTFYI
jgi:hypothetical protein